MKKENVNKKMSYKKREILRKNKRKNEGKFEYYIV